MRGNVPDIRNDSASTTIPRRADCADIDAERRLDNPPNFGDSGFPDLSEMRETLKEVDIAPMERALTRPAGSRGRRPYPRGPIIRARLSIPVLGIADISALRKELLNNPALRAACGFITRVPSRSTFSIVFGQMNGMRETLEELLAKTAEKLAERLPDLGEAPNRTPVSDPDAGWGLKRKASAHGGRGLGLRIQGPRRCGRRHDIPLTVAATTGSQNDTTYLAAMVEETSPTPGVVIADRGYDSRDNSEWLHRRGIAPVQPQAQAPEPARDGV